MTLGQRRDLGRFATAAAVFAAITVGVPVLLVAASRAWSGAANPLHGVAPPWRWFDDAGAISEPVSDDAVLDLVIRLCLCVAWVAVAVVVVTTVTEVAHLVRHGLHRPTVRAIGWSQPLARWIAVGLLAVLPLVQSSSTLAVRGSDPTPHARDTPHALAPATPADDLPDETLADRTLAGTATVGHVVQPGESVYSIAESIAARSGRAVIDVADDILDRNLGASMGGGQRFTNPAYIQAGWVLDVPATGVHPTADVRPSTDVTASTGATSITVPEAAEVAGFHVVRPGDTLWDIAGERLGDATRWPAIWERNAGRDMGDGRTFDDPDLIRPGWQLDLPEPSAPEQPIVPDPSTVPERPAVPDEPPSTDDRPIIDLDAPIIVDDVPADQAEPATSATPSTTTTIAVTTSTTAPPVAVGQPGDAAGDAFDAAPSPDAPSPIRLEHAALLAAGVLALVGVRRRQRLRSAQPRHRVPEPRPDVIDTERRLRAIDAGERAARVDVACRAIATAVLGTPAQVGSMIVSVDGDVVVRLTAPAVLGAPWMRATTGDGDVDPDGAARTWRLDASIPIELLSDDARQVAMPCMALVQVGVAPTGDDVLVDLEACGVLAIEAARRPGDEVVTAIAAALASSVHAEAAHLIGVELSPPALLGHRNGHSVESVDAAFDLAAELVGTTVDHERTTFTLRSLRTGGEMWEPAVMLLTAADDGAATVASRTLPEPGRGLAVVLAADRQVDAPARIVAGDDGWSLVAFGERVEMTPIGVSRADLAAIDDVLADASLALEPAATADELPWSAAGDDGVADDDDDENASVADAVAAPFRARQHEIVVGLMGAVTVADRDGVPGSFERSKTVELIAWLATHRERSTRSGARAALWDLDVRDATFANVVSEARRALARLVPPPEGEEWVARTLTDQLPIHELVVTDAQLIEERLAAARVQPPAQAMATLAPAVELIRDLPFAGTSYLWPDAEGLTSNLVLLAISVTTEYAAHALSLGDTDGVFWATGRGLTVLAGHEELIALRMRAHARSGDLAGVRQEWAAYERVLVADAWSDGEPAPKLVTLRHELLSSS